MAELVDHLAELTGFRDRELLDVTLVGALRDLLRPRAVAIYRSVGEAGQERWLTRARLSHDDLAASADPAWIDLDGLPRHEEHPHRLQAFHDQAIVLVAGDPHRAFFPVATDREQLGVMEVESEAPLDERDQRLVMSILRIYRNFQGLLDYSERDTLTGLLNRKTFDESFLKMVAQPAPAVAGAAGGGRRRQSVQLSRNWLGVIDIDHFKRVNDSYGHLIGDEVLLLMSRLMRSSFRFDDRLYRFGGEEFVVLMRCADGDAAALAFERLRHNVERHLFPQVGHITVSIGFTELKAGDTPNGAFERADKAVYFAKGNGRNQLHHHADLVAAGHLADDAKIGDVELF
ncbi:MAG: GGDEF domain-containing protein [Proteobacteria bacterium]|uniref:GGDEF domain-containing protein n=1 Tax=Piscinibacter sp. TaxID=1903157 RepID=UPI0035B32EAD|nr:GGDEF domain-containing protein [Pseudomonadota bacterium]